MTNEHAPASTTATNRVPVSLNPVFRRAILGATGIPSVLFGPGGAGLHSIEEYVHVADVIACRDVLADLVLAWTAG